MNKKTIGLLSMLVFILLIIWGYNSLYNPKVVDNINTNSDNKPEEVDTSDWREYRNEELGFEFKYPSGWMMEENKNFDNNEEIGYISFRVATTTANPYTFGTSRVLITIFPNPENITPEEIIIKYNNFANDVLNSRFLGEVILDNKIVKKYSIPGYVELPSLIFKYKQMVYEISYTLGEEELNKILYTFKFIN
ncbi:MAG: hypothetical protein WCS88_04145 [Patescibacteria group bacterium]|jgi:hypothetical protein